MAVALQLAPMRFERSVEVGRQVGEVCAGMLKGSVLELGGKDPMIVCADADLDNAISGAVWGGFANAGQTCSGIERVYVLREVADRFVAGVAREAERQACNRAFSDHGAHRIHAEIPATNEAAQKVERL